MATDTSEPAFMGAPLALLSLVELDHVAAVSPDLQRCSPPHYRRLQVRTLMGARTTLYAPEIRSRDDQRFGPDACLCTVYRRC